jgi:hypothetical protein
MSFAVTPPIQALAPRPSSMPDLNRIPHSRTVSVVWNSTAFSPMPALSTHYLPVTYTAVFCCESIEQNKIP